MPPFPNQSCHFILPLNILPEHANIDEFSLLKVMSFKKKIKLQHMKENGQPDILRFVLKFLFRYS